MPSKQQLEKMTNFITPISTSILTIKINMKLSNPSPGKPLGLCEIAGPNANSSEVHLTRFAGIPKNPETYKQTAIKAGGFVWKLFLNGHGKWSSRMGSTGKVFNADLYIHGPLCPLNSAHSTFILRRHRVFGKQWHCLSCPGTVKYTKFDKTIKEISKELLKRLNREFELR